MLCFLKKISRFLHKILGSRNCFKIKTNTSLPGYCSILITDEGNTAKIFKTWIIIKYFFQIHLLLNTSSYFSEYSRKHNRRIKQNKINTTNQFSLGDFERNVLLNDFIKIRNFGFCIKCRPDIEKLVNAPFKAKQNSYCHYRFHLIWAMSREKALQTFRRINLAVHTPVP